MVFSSSIFLFLFFPAVFVINLLLPRSCSNYFLLLASLVFYAWGEPVFVFLMLTSIVINWFCGIRIEKNEGAGRKIWLIAAVAVDLALLGYFKYFNLFINVMNRIAGWELFEPTKVALPIGISFFTFQAISYVADVYRKETKAASSLVNVALYISFFSQLIAGPIVKYKDINRQIEERSLAWTRTEDGFKRFIYGFAKKVLIANTLALSADAVYGHSVAEIDPVAAWIGALAYTFQIYYDFSGYSDMAIGLGKMFGFDYLENFNYPYFSGSISEFWRRWHMSLGSWFREYLYIPLGGNRKGKVRTYLNLGIVFLLTGLWHGAHFTFVTWGAYHGFFTIAERLGMKKWLDKHRVLSTIYCFLVVHFGWVLFRADTVGNGIRFILRMIFPWRYRIGYIPIWRYLDLKIIIAFALAILGSGLLNTII